MFELNNHNCPKCNSSNTYIGAFVLECLDCKWHYLNKYPCRICQGPSISCYGYWNSIGDNETFYYCKEHPINDADYKYIANKFKSNLPLKA